MFFMLTLCKRCTKKLCAAQKNVSTKKIFDIAVNVAHQNYVSHKKNMLWQQKNNVALKRRSMFTRLNTFSVAQKRNIC